MSIKNLDSTFYYKKSRLQQLKGFCYTAQFGSTIKASEKMGLGNNAVSMQIKSLERDLETKLFDRSKNRLKLNENGRMLYEMAVPLIQSADGLFERFLDKKNNVKNNKINIGAYHIIFSHILPPIIKTHLLKYPENKFILRNIPRSLAYKDLMNDVLDLVIYPIEKGEKIPNELESIYKFKYELVLIINKNHKLAKKKDIEITKDDIANNNFIYHLNKKMITARTWLNFVRDYNVVSNIEIESGDWETVKALVSQNIGIGVMSKTYINENDKNIITKSITHLFPDFSFDVIIKRNSFINQTTKHFIELLQDN